MKLLSGDFKTHLASGATTLCWCWKLIRNDNIVFGFTGHDRLIDFDNIDYEPSSGFEGTEIASSAGLDVDNLDVMGALMSSRLNEADLAAGLFDNAAIEIWRVNWADPDQRVLMRKGNLGEVSREENAFTAEVRGLAHILNQPHGRIYQYGCDADPGDARCGIDLEASAFKGTGTIISASASRTIQASGLSGFAAGWFEFGRILWLTGANTGRSMEVKTHRLTGSEAAIGLWQPMSEEIAAGDTFSIYAGCDKQFSTCGQKFSNGLNFRGFPHMPGNDFLISYPGRDDSNNDGGSLN